MDPSNPSGSSGKSREQLLEDQLASERRERTLERELERARRGGGEASPGGGGGASGRVANGANGATKGSVLVVWDFGESRVVALPLGGYGREKAIKGKES